MEPMESLLSPRKEEYLAVGLMSGTSADGVDAALVRFIIQGSNIQDQLLEYMNIPYPRPLREKVFKLFRDEAGSLNQVCQLNFEIGAFFARAAEKLIRRSGFPREAIRVIGSHGQTVYHLPPNQKNMGAYTPSTLQIGEASFIAQQTGLPVASDFRTADIAAGGEGAPLVPIADYYLLRHSSRTRIIQNIGGIANTTFLPAGGSLDDVIAFDSGPGNMILDAVVKSFSKGREAMDRGGKRAMRGKPDIKWLEEIMRNPYFTRKPPKTTGRELFGEQFTAELLKEGARRKLKMEDILATAAMLTVESIVQGYEKFCFPRSMPQEVILGGGGARNAFLVNALKQRLPESIRIVDHETLGINSQAKEALAFALLGLLCILGHPGNVPSATGARKSVSLGKLYYP